MAVPPIPAPSSASRIARTVTAHDVARVAGVSAITVSCALNSLEQLSQATQVRVREAIAQTGYVPNLLARNLNANKSTRLGRSEAFVTRARELGLPDVAVMMAPAPGTLAGGRTSLARLLNKHPRTDAVFCSSDIMALGALTEVHARDMDVPTRLAVVGFGDLDFCASLHPALTSVRIDANAIGGQAAQFIIDRAEGHAPVQTVVDVGFTLIERGSS